MSISAQLHSHNVLHLKYWNKDDKLEFLVDGSPHLGVVSGFLCNQKSGALMLGVYDIYYGERVIVLPSECTKIQQDSK